jgi:hypothetical protein
MENAPKLFVHSSTQNTIRDKAFNTFVAFEETYVKILRSGPQPLETDQRKMIELFYPEGTSAPPSDKPAHYLILKFPLKPVIAKQEFHPEYLA